MATPNFPSGLPGVSKMSIRPFDNVLKDSPPGVMSFRRRSKNRYTLNAVEWIFLGDDLNTFLNFTRTTIKSTHKFFWMTIPSAYGMVNHIVRFKGKPKIDSLGHQAWRVTAELIVLETVRNLVDIAPTGSGGGGDLTTVLIYDFEYFAGPDELGIASFKEVVTNTIIDYDVASNNYVYLTDTVYEYGTRCLRLEAQELYNSSPMVVPAQLSKNWTFEVSVKSSDGLSGGPFMQWYSAEIGNIEFYIGTGYDIDPPYDSYPTIGAYISGGGEPFGVDVPFSTSSILDWNKMMFVIDGDARKYHAFANGTRLVTGDIPSGFIEDEWGFSGMRFGHGGALYSYDHPFYVDNIRISNAALQTGLSYTPPTGPFVYDPG